MEDQYKDILKPLNFKIKEVDDINVDNDYNNYNCYMDSVNNKIPTLYYMIHSSNNYAFIPNNFNNYELLKYYNIIPAKMNYLCHNGLMITSDGDLRLVITVPESINLPINYFLVKLKMCLYEYFDKVKIHHNDIMINNKKVGSYAFNIMNEMYIYIIHLTFIDNSELIKKVCMESTKQPGFINPNIISQESLLNKIISWIK